MSESTSIGSVEPIDSQVRGKLAGDVELVEEADEAALEAAGARVRCGLVGDASLAKEIGEAARRAGLSAPYYSHRWPGPSATAASHCSRTSEPSYSSPRGLPLEAQRAVLEVLTGDPSPADMPQEGCLLYCCSNRVEFTGQMHPSMNGGCI